MNTSLRRLALSIGVALSALAAGACGDDSTPAEVADALAQDSTLELAIYGAASDSAPSPAESADSALTNDGDAASPAVVAQRAPLSVNAARARPVMQRTPSEPRDAHVSPGASRQRRIAAARTEALTSRRQATTRRESLQRANTGRREMDVPTEPMGATALVPAGTSLSFAAANQICTATSQVGDRFSLRVAEGLVGPLGTVIPAGSTATGEIASLSEPGDDVRMGVRIAAVEISGRTYPVESQVASPKLARIRTQGGDPRYTGCVRNGARITAELSSPLRIRVLE